jgi:hypothetical protein
VIDTLKLAKRLQRANLSAEQAEIIAEALAEAQADCATKSGAVADFRAEISQAVADWCAEIRADFAKTKNELIPWIVGSVAIGVLINHFWK